MTLRTLELFAGIGGLSRGLELGGDFTPVAFCERDLYARMVLKKHWPEVPQYADVCTLSGHTLARDGIGIDVVAGGWPCQPHSVAGKRENSEDDRDLWHEFARIIGETRPRWVVGENVPGVLSSHDAAAGRGAGGFFGRVLRDLAALRYDAEWHCFPASAIGAHHERQRLFVVAYPNGLWEPQPEGAVTHERGRAVYGGERPGTLAHPDRQSLAVGESVRGDPRPELQAAERDGCALGRTTGEGLPDWAGGMLGRPWPVTELERPGGREIECDFRGMAHGVSARVDRIRTLGNAVVPQQAAVIGRAIAEAEAHLSRYRVMPERIVHPRHVRGQA